MRMKFTAKLTMLLVFLLSLFQLAIAQNRTVTGRVTDPAGAGIPGVTVTVQEPTMLLKPLQTERLVFKQRTMPHSFFRLLALVHRKCEQIMQQL